MLHFAENWAALAEWAKRHAINIVRYEDLVSKPQETLADLCRGCGLPFEEQMLLTVRPECA